MKVTPSAQRIAPAVGAEIPPFAVTVVDADHIRIVALLLCDSNPIHFDVDHVTAAGLGDREINQGASTLAYVYDMLIAWTGSRAAVVRVRCQFRANVFAGDHVVAGGRITEVRAVDGGAEVDADVWVDKLSDGTRAIRGTATVLLDGTLR